MVIAGCLLCCAIAAGRADEPGKDFTPDVARLAELSDRDDQESVNEIPRVVANLANEKQWGLKGLAADSPDSPKIKALVLSTGQEKHVLLAIHYPPVVVPGPDVQLLLVLAPDGTLRDRMTCEINSRLTATAIGAIGYHVRRDTDRQGHADSATIYLAGRKGAEVAPNFSCTFRHGDKLTTMKLSPQSGDERWTMDLCHCKVKAGVFEVAASTMKK